MTEKVESVEALADNLMRNMWQWNTGDYVQSCGRLKDKLAGWLRSHNIDPATMQPTEKQQPADECGIPSDGLAFTIKQGEIKYTDVVLNVDRGEYTLTQVDYEATKRHGMRIEVPCDGRERPYSVEILFPAEALSRFVAELTAMQIERNAGKQQPAEPVVTDEDKLIAKKILHLLRDYGTITDAGMRHWLGEYSAVFTIIAKARQSERDELRQAQLTGVSQMNEIRSLKEKNLGLIEEVTLATRANESLQAKLTAAEARVRELELSGSLEVSSNPSFVRFANLEYKSIWINPTHVKAVVGVVDYPGCGAARETSIVTDGDSWTIRTRESVSDVLAKLGQPTEQPATADAKGGA